MLNMKKIFFSTASKYFSSPNVWTSRPVPIFKIIFLRPRERPQKNALDKRSVADEKKHFFAAAVAAAKKCTRQSLP